VGEEIAGLPEAAAVGVAAGPEPEPIGAYLSRQRRLRGIGLDELARVTCIPLRSLERLESGAFDAAPDGFARGFVRTVAAALGLDPDDTVSRMLPEMQPGVRRRRPPLPESGAPWAAAVMTLLAVGLVAVFLVERSTGPPTPAELRAQQVVRRDVVRELARQQGLLAGGEGQASQEPLPNAP